MIHTRCLSQHPSVRKMSSYESKPVTIASADVFFAAGIRIAGSGTEKGVLIPYSRSFFTKIPQYPAVSRIPHPAIFFFIFSSLSRIPLLFVGFFRKSRPASQSAPPLGTFSSRCHKESFTILGPPFAVVELPMKLCLRFFTIND